MVMENIAPKILQLCFLLIKDEGAQGEFNLEDEEMTLPVFSFTPLRPTYTKSPLSCKNPSQPFFNMLAFLTLPGCSNLALHSTHRALQVCALTYSRGHYPLPNFTFRSALTPTCNETLLRTHRATPWYNQKYLNDISFNHC